MSAKVFPNNDVNRLTISTGYQCGSGARTAPCGPPRNCNPLLRQPCRFPRQRPWERIQPRPDAEFRLGRNLVRSTRVRAEEARKNQPRKHGAGAPPDQYELMETGN